MNTKTQPKEAPKMASKTKRILASLIDCTCLYFLVVQTFGAFDIMKIFPHSPVFLQYLIVTLYFNFFLVVVPQLIFSQTLGKFILGLKVVTPKKFERIGLFQSILHSLFLGSLAKSVVVDIR